MKIIGITGSSGSGKTTIANILKENYEAKIVDADKIVKEMTIPGTDYMNSIKKDLGQEFVYEDGNMNKKRLAEKIYNDETALKTLNNLTFKYIVDEMKQRVLQAKEKYVIIDAPLLIEAKLDELCDFIIAVVADEDIKLERICKRDNLDIQTAKSRLKIQKHDDFYKSKSDFTITNNGQEDLEKEISKIINEIENNN